MLNTVRTPASATVIAHWINGARVTSVGARTADVYNPATGAVTGTALLATVAEASAAVAAAKAAFPGWAALPAARRANIMYKLKDLLERRADALAAIISSEHGKTHGDALGEIRRAIEVVEFACAGPQLLKSEFTGSVGADIDSYSLRQPLGVVVGITPFNFPVMVPMWMAPVALACGNTFILKPSERTPSASLMLAELFAESGVPDGVFNVIQGDHEAVDALLNHVDVKAVSFVGSTAVAKHVYTLACANGKRVQALGGAKNHLIVMPDADIALACDALIGAAYGSAGERCMAISVAVAVGEETAEALIERLVPRVRNLVVGPACDATTEMGPLISAAHRERVESCIDAGIAEGANLLVDGRKLCIAGYEDGFFIGGTLFDGVSSDMRIYREEIFGPVLGVVRVANYREAVNLVNAHAYGNGTAVFTRNGDTARSFAREIEVGMVGINVPIPVPMAFHSFGGWKDSMFGDHCMHGPEGVRFYTKLKTVTERWPRADGGGTEFALPNPS